MKKGLAIALAAASLTAGTFVAQPAQAADKDINAWKHCGLGAMIFDENETAAAFSNIIWDLGSTALTSATVSEDTCESKMVQTARFIDENYNQLETELAIGEGRHVDTMMTMMDVAENDRAVVVNQLRSALVIDNERTNSEKAQTLFYSAQNVLAAQAG